MKILVLFNECYKPQVEAILSDIKGYYYNKEAELRPYWGSKFAGELERIACGEQVDVFFYSTANNSISGLADIITEEKPEMLISYNLVGFEYRTLTDNYSLNLYSLPQIHFCEEAIMKRLDGTTAINMFFTSGR